MDDYNLLVYRNMKGAGVEYEYQFPDFKRSELLNGLDDLGAKKLHKRVKYNVTYFYPPGKKDFYRVRKEHKIVTFTKKILRNDQNLPALEYEIAIEKGSSYDEIVAFVSDILPKKYKRNIINVEKYREKWIVGKGCHEVVIDEWPGLPPYIEVDCTTQEALDRVVKLLNLNMDTSFRKGSFDLYQRIYGIKNRGVLFDTSLTFTDIEKSLAKYVTRDKKILKDFQHKYKTSPKYK